MNGRKDCIVPAFVMGRVYLKISIGNICYVHGLKYWLLLIMGNNQLSQPLEQVKKEKASKPEKCKY